MGLCHIDTLCIQHTKTEAYLQRMEMLCEDWEIEINQETQRWNRDGTGHVVGTELTQICLLKKFGFLQLFPLLLSTALLQVTILSISPPC